MLKYEGDRMKNNKILMILLCVVGLALVAYGSISLLGNEEKIDAPLKQPVIKTGNILYDSYEQMKTNSGFNGYTLTLSLSEVPDDGSFSDSYLDVITIENYMDKSYKITVNNKKTLNDYNIYKVNGNYYSHTENGRLVKTDLKTIYDNPLLYIESLKTGTELSSGEKISVDGKEYTKYTYKVAEAVMKKMLEKTALNEFLPEEYTEATLLVDSSGYIYSLDYTLGELENGKMLIFQLRYSGINKAVSYE